MQIFLSNSASQTKKIGERMAKKILRLRGKKAVILALEGDLGGGKTTFLQGFAKGIGIKEKILSPTFVIMRKFALIRAVRTRGVRAEDVKPKKHSSSFQHDRVEMRTGMAMGKFNHLYHFDCYRIQGPKEILALGWRDILRNPQNIVAVEWAEKIKNILPKNCLRVKFDFVGRAKRRITFKNFQFFNFQTSPCQKKKDLLN